MRTRNGIKFYKLRRNEKKDKEQKSLKSKTFQKLTFLRGLGAEATSIILSSARK